MQLASLPLVELKLYWHTKSTSAKLAKNAGITSKNGRNDAKRLNINVVTVTNDDKMKKRKTQ